MNQKLGTRFAIIALVVITLGWWAYQGVYGGRLEQGTDLKGGSELGFRFEFTDVQPGLKRKLLDEAIQIVQSRVDGFGLKDIEITPLGDDTFSLEVSANDKAVVESIKELVTVLGNLEFRITVEKDGIFQGYEKYWKQFQEARKKGLDDAAIIKFEDLDPEDKANAPMGLKWYELSASAKGDYPRARLPDNGDPFVLCVIDKFDVGGDALSTVNYERPQREVVSNEWAVTFSVKREWQGRMASLTDKSKQSQKFMAIILNEKVDSAPNLRERLRSSGQITGGFDETEAKTLAAVLRSGALKEKPVLISERTIAAELAGAERDRGVLSTLIAFALVLVMMVYLYKGPGLLANIALLLNLVLLIGVLAFFEAVLTLPGIAALVLTVGMAVDANILVFERIKEERAKGRTVTQAVETGYDRALVTIIDANLTTLITAYFLFQIGSGPVRGFGITLAIGILVSMFTALYVTRTLLTWLMSKGIMSECSMRGEYNPPKIDWMSKKRKAVLTSACAMLIGAILWEAVPETVRYDLDFSEGSRLVVRFHSDVPKSEVETRIASLAKEDDQYADVTVRASAEGIGAAVAADTGRIFEIRSQKISTQETIDKFERRLRTLFADKLVPGPFRETIADDGQGNATGVLTFVGDQAQTPWLAEAFQSFSRANNVLRGAQVAEIENVQGAGKTFRVTFSDSPDTARDIDLAVDKALKAFDANAAAAALTYLESEASAEGATEETKAALTARATALKETPFPKEANNVFALTDPLPSADRVDPFTARQHRDAAIRAVGLSILGIILYVAFRFRSWAFGFAAVVALIHDVLVVLGVVALANASGLVDARLNLVTVAAFLTLIGYSINDTIVVFDRIRENRGTGTARLGSILNKSINQTFTRTIRTTSTTWVVVTILFVMNIGSGSPLEGFAFILMAGVLVGTYSSIFIASPTLIYLPWLWKQSGGTVGSFAKRVLPYAAGSFVILLALDALQGHLTGDWSKIGFADFLLSIPMGMLLLFLLQFVKFTADEDGDTATATAV